MINVFTKEELKDLLDCCKAAYISGEINPQKPLQIKHKIQSMIDNYCGHELINYCCGCDPENIVCDKCHRDLWGTKHE